MSPKALEQSAIDAQLLVMVARQQKAKEAATKVDFGDFDRPHAKILNQWQALGFPAEQMQHMNASNYSKLLQQQQHMEQL